MRVKVQLVIGADNGEFDTIHDVAVLEKGYHRIEQLELALLEAKRLLTQLQQHIVARQAAAFVRRRSQCEACGAPLRRKEATPRLLRTLFGTVLLTSPRLYRCWCQTHTTRTFRPLTALLTASTTPEVLFVETKWAAWLSYGMTARVLKDFLPEDETLNATTVHNHTLAVAQSCEEELGEDEGGGSDSCPEDDERLAHSEGPIAVGLDGGYVRDWDQKRHHFEIIVGKSMPSDQPATCFGFVQSYDTKAKQRLDAGLQSQGAQDARPFTFLSDGGETVRALPMPLHPQSGHLLDWMHLTMRVTVLKQHLRGLIPLDREVGEGLQRQLESVKWLLWHGKVTKALDRLGNLDQRMDHFTDIYPRCPRLQRSVRKLRTYIENNRSFIPNYGQRYRNGETISTAFVESTVNSVLSKRFVKKQSMQWTKRGAPLLLQTRVKTLNNELASTFQHWYPDFRVEEPALAASCPTI